MGNGNSIRAKRRAFGKFKRDLQEHYNSMCRWFGKEHVEAGINAQVDQMIREEDERILSILRNELSKKDFSFNSTTENCKVGV